MRGLSPSRRHIAGIVLALGLLAVAVLAAPAGALTARFTLNDEADYTRGLRVTAGDDGWTPFFRPAVVVWDGGSIISGHGADAGFEFPTQTLAVLPHVCQSYVSATGGADRRHARRRARRGRRTLPGGRRPRPVRRPCRRRGLP